jgi:hypothetical protein
MLYGMYYIIRSLLRNGPHQYFEKERCLTDSENFRRIDTQNFSKGQHYINRTTKSLSDRLQWTRPPCMWGFLAHLLILRWFVLKLVDRFHWKNTRAMMRHGSASKQLQARLVNSGADSWFTRLEGQKQIEKELTQETPESNKKTKKRSDSIGTDATIIIDTSL